MLYYHEFMFLLWQRYIMRYCLKRNDKNSPHINGIMEKLTYDLKRKIWVLLYTQLMENMISR